MTEKAQRLYSLKMTNSHLYVLFTTAAEQLHSCRYNCSWRCYLNTADNYATGTRSLAGVGATPGQSLLWMCKFRSEIIDLLYCMLLFFLFEALRLNLETCSKHQDFFWFPEKLPWCIICLLLLLFVLIPNAFCSTWVALASDPDNSLQQRLGSFVLWKSVERQNFFKARRFRLQSLHILHVRCKFCVFRAVGRNLQFLHVWLRLRENSIVHRDGQAQERAEEKLERNRRWFERKKSTSLVRAANAPVRTANAPVRAANAPVRAANAPYGELHTSTNSRSLDHERGEHTTRRLCIGRGLGQSRTNLCRSKALRWSVRLSTFDTSFCSGPDCADMVKTSLLACS